jgi:hypothetical protein
MNTNELLDRQKVLERLYTTKSEIHSKRFNISVNEASYQTSVAELREIYEELHDICHRLNTPIPTWI